MSSQRMIERLQQIRIRQYEIGQLIEECDCGETCGQCMALDGEWCDIEIEGNEINRGLDVLERRASY